MVQQTGLYYSDEARCLALGFRNREAEPWRDFFCSALVLQHYAWDVLAASLLRPVKPCLAGIREKFRFPENLRYPTENEGNTLKDKALRSQEPQVSVPWTSK